MSDDLRWLPLADLVPWDRNPRHNDVAAKKLVQLLRTMAPDGNFRRVWTSPISVQAGTMRIIGGHTRFKAATQLGMTEVPVKVLEVDDAEATRLALADNRVGEEAEWDEDALAELLADDPNPLDLGWDEEELRAKPEPEIVEWTPEPEEQPERLVLRLDLKHSERAALEELIRERFGPIRIFMAWGEK